jgi:hypothetical protein
MGIFDSKKSLDIILREVPPEKTSSEGEQIPSPWHSFPGPPTRADQEETEDEREDIQGGKDQVDDWQQNQESSQQEVRSSDRRDTIRSATAFQSRPRAQMITGDIYTGDQSNKPQLHRSMMQIETTYWQEWAVHERTGVVHLQMCLAERFWFSEG